MVMFVIPCADACENNSHEIKFSLQSAQDHHEEHNDTCSPFCTCSCCAQQITFNNFPTLSFASPQIVLTFSFFKQLFISSFLSAIWQPPKIS